METIVKENIAEVLKESNIDDPALADMLAKLNLEDG